MISVEGALRHQYPRLFHYPTYISKPTISFFKLLFHEDSINDFLTKNTTTGLSFIDAVLDHLNISYKVDNKQIQNIPSLGKVIIVSNHPLGALDALALIKLVTSIRQDKKVKIVANDMLSQFTQLKEYLIPIDNISGRLSKKSLQSIEEALNDDEAVLFFPSGEVSRAYFNGIKDGKWKSGFVKFSKRTQSPILPVYIKAKNSTLFYGVSWLYKPFGTLLLGHEMIRARNSVFEFNVGELIASHTISDMRLDHKQHARLFRKHLYRIVHNKRGIYQTEQCIAHPESRQEIKQELINSERIGMTSDNKHIYLVEYENAPTLLSEIGRLREYSFRKVGEGSGQHRDLDRYDKFYQHLLLWDDDALEVVGAYRIGECDWVLSRLGKKGLYMNELCKIDDQADEYLKQAIELGRSFVQPKYWGTRALDYLWQGIGAYLSHNPHIKYMYGPVSISAMYPRHAQEALVYFYKNYFGAKEPSMHARTPYRLSHSTAQELEVRFNGDDYLADFRELKRYLCAFNVTVPTLFKQYSELCEEGGVQFMDFGIDTEFKDCIDGYILVEINKIKAVKRKRYIDAV